ncbi:MAG TPA: hypothetical protein ENO21_04120, partial [Firmicutes bacterium]|nr:hypothetical protein [Bacillota bacterium]
VRYSAKDLSALVDKAVPAGDIKRLLESLNGFYAICYLDQRGTVVAAVDRARSIPLFYAVQDGRLVISDDARWVANQVGATDISRRFATDLLMTAFVTGRNTLVDEVRQLQLGELLEAERIRGGWNLKTSYHYHFHHQASTDCSLGSQRRKLESALDAAAVRLLDYASGRQILLALSGGLDSTMLALALRRRGCDNVSAFTYGSRHSLEIRHSREVAETLGFPWACSYYTPGRWRSWLAGDSRRSYWDWSHNLCSLPHVQDYMAVEELLERGDVRPDAVVVAGQSVEAFYGIQFAPEDWAALRAPGFSAERLADIVYRLHYRLWPGSCFGRQTREEMKQLILDSLGSPEDYGTAVSYFEAWVVREKMAKFNNNSVRAYEQLGLDWWLPLFDHDIIRFWIQLPCQLRYGRAFTRGFVPELFRSVTSAGYDYTQGYSGYEQAARRFRPLVWRGGWPAELYLALKRELKYSRDRMGWYQVIHRALYRRLFHYRFNINSLLVLEFLGALNLGQQSGWLEGLRLPEELELQLAQLAG